MVLDDTECDRQYIKCMFQGCQLDFRPDVRHVGVSGASCASTDLDDPVVKYYIFALPLRNHHMLCVSHNRYGLPRYIMSLRPFGIWQHCPHEIGRLEGFESRETSNRILALNHAEYPGGSLKVNSTHMCHHVHGDKVALQCGWKGAVLAARSGCCILLQ
jgi:hypothetical protein